MATIARHRGVASTMRHRWIVAIPGRSPDVRMLTDAEVGMLGDTLRRDGVTGWDITLAAHAEGMHRCRDCQPGMRCDFHGRITTTV